MNAKWTLPWLWAGLASAAHASSCLVLGDASARVQTPDGVRAPVFMAPACDQLRLVQGQASASWVGRDGRPRVVPVTPGGVAEVPQWHSEERAVKKVWTELATRREGQKPAYMRSLAPPEVYVAREGLELLARADAPLRLRLVRVDGDHASAVVDRTVEPGQPVVLQRAEVTPDALYRVELIRDEERQSWQWRTPTEADTATIDIRREAIAAAIAAADQRLMLEAVLFEQLMLPVNLDLVIQRLRQGTAP